MTIPKNSNKVPLSLTEVAAGFPSPADDFLESELDLNEYLIESPPSTFLVRVSGLSMKNAGIFPGDILVVDRSLSACHNKIVIAVVDGEMTVKRLMKGAEGWFLKAENRAYSSIQLGEKSELSIWGVVVAVIRKLEGL